MNKRFLILVLAATVLFTSFASMGPSGNTTNALPLESLVTLATPQSHSGNVTIYSNGTVSNQTVISGTSGTYTLEMNVNGFVLDERNNSVFSGNGYIINSTGVGFEVAGSNNVTLSDLNITNSQTGILLKSTSAVNIQKSAINSTCYGVYISTSQYSGISNSKITSVSYGIYLNYSSSISVISSHITSGTGFTSYTSTSFSRFINDTFISKFDGLLFSGNINSNITVTGSKIIASDPLSAMDGLIIYSETSNNLLVSNNTIISSNGYGIKLDTSESANSTITYNNISGVYDGIYVYDQVNTVIMGNLINNYSNTAIYMEYDVNSRVIGNTILTKTKANNIEAIFAEYDPSNDIVSKNTIIGNNSLYSEAICYDSSSNFRIFNNTISNYYYSVQIEYSGNFAVYGNSMLNSYYGLSSYSNFHYNFYNNTVFNSTYNLYLSGEDSFGTFTGNTFDNSTGTLLTIVGSSNIEFYHNNFVNGTNVTSKISGNTLLSFNQSLPIGGNYWSNYTGTGSNGIGNKHYNISSGYVDYLPLTSMWGSYSITFVEKGLPTGTNWAVNLGGAAQSSSFGHITFTPSAAQHITESYTIAKVPGYTLSLASGTVSLNGASQVVTVAFTPITYNVTFSETGLTNNTNWSVTFNGKTLNSNTTKISFTAIDGTYSVQVNGVSGYVVISTLNNLTVSNSNTTVNVNFTAITTTTINTGNSGNSGSSVYEGLGIGIVIGGIVAAFGTMLYTGTGPFKNFKLGKKAP